MRASVIVFPGSNCDHDLYHASKKVVGFDTEFVWHKDHDLKKADIVMVPGGFSYGDYLRAGAIAAKSPIMNEVVKFANDGGLVVGICNGFQVLTEAGLLPGALNRNAKMKFICRDVRLKVENNTLRFTNQYDKDQIITIPIAHADGNFYAEADTVKSLNDNGQVVFRYVDSDGNAATEANPNGSVDNIAGIVNKAGNVLGMMPHPERAVEDILKGTDGLKFFKSLAK